MVSRSLKNWGASALVVISLLLCACGGGPGKRVAQLEGTYALIRVNGLDLPFTPRDSVAEGNCLHGVLDGTLAITPTGSFHLATDVRDACNQNGVMNSENMLAEDTGTVLLRGNIISFMHSPADTSLTAAIMQGRFAGDTLSLYHQGQRLTFTFVRRAQGADSTKAPN
jgi:hypothetical protein